MKQIRLNEEQKKRLGIHAEKMETSIYKMLEEFDNSERFNMDPNDASWPEDLKSAFQEEVAAVVSEFGKGLRDYLVAGMPDSETYWQSSCVHTVKPVHIEYYNITFSPFVLANEAYDALDVLLESINAAEIYGFWLALDFASTPEGFVHIKMRREK